MGRIKVATAKREMVQQEPTAQKTRLQEIVSEEAEKILNEMRSEEMLHKHFSDVEDFIAGSLAELKKKALERYRQEQAEAQS